MNRQSTPWLKILAVNLALCVLGVAVLELLFGLWVVDANAFSRLRIDRDVVHRYQLRELYPWPEMKIRYTRDRFGLRGDYASPSDIDILTVGGSTTNQRFVADGHTWQDRLAREFAAAGDRVSVVNAGVDGQSTFGHLRNFDWWFPLIPGLAPDYILFYVGINDVYKQDGRYHDRVTHDRPPPRLDWRGHVLEKSALVHLFRTLEGWWLAVELEAGYDRVDFSKVRWRLLDMDQVAADVDREELAAVLDAYDSRLTELVRRTREMGAAAILVTQTTARFRVEPEGVYSGDGQEDYYYKLRAYNERTLEVARRLGVPGIDLATEIDLEIEDFYDWTHNTPAGARKIGEYLHGKLRPIVRP